MPPSVYDIYSPKYMLCFHLAKVFNRSISAAIQAPASASNLIASSVFDVILENSTSLSARRIILPISPNRPLDTNSLLCLSAISSIPVFKGFFCVSLSDSGCRKSSPRTVCAASSSSDHPRCCMPRSRSRCSSKRPDKAG